MVYEPRETPLLAAARAKGCVTIDGVEMLVAQAVGQFEAWTGLPAPVEAMAEAAATRSPSRASRRPRERPRDRPAHAGPARRPVLRRRGGPGEAPHRGARGLGLRRLGLRGDHPAAVRLRRCLRRRGARLEDLLVRGARREPARAAAGLHEPAREDRRRTAARARGAAAALLLGRGRALRARAGRPTERALPDGPRAPGRRGAGGGRRGGGDRGRVPRAAGRRGFVLALGHVGVFAGLVEAAGLAPERVEALRERVESKDPAGVRQVLQGRGNHVGARGGVRAARRRSAAVSRRSPRPPRCSPAARRPRRRSRSCAP